jgi:hypothetical protein
VDHMALKIKSSILYPDNILSFLEEKKSTTRR